MQVKSTVIFVKVKLLFIYFGSTSVSKDYQQIFQYMHFKFEKDFFLNILNKLISTDLIKPITERHLVLNLSVPSTPLSN